MQHQEHDILPQFSLANQFLLAMPSLDDSFFAGSLVYICQHNQDGAMGIVINKPSMLPINFLFDIARVPTPKRFQDGWIMIGGPVRIDRGILLHTPVGSWQNSLIVTDDIAATTSGDILNGLLKEDVVHKALVTVGHCAWGPGQLEKEVAQHAWLNVQAQPGILFDLPVERRYQAALGVLNLDVARISGTVGHA